MAENSTDRTATSYSDSTQNPTPSTSPSPSPSTTFTCKKRIEEDEAAPESKRRKSCPTALDKIDESSLSSTPNNFSFTFDTKFTPCTPQFTPKFGSFNLVVVPAPDSTEDQLSSENLKDKEGACEKEEKENESTGFSHEERINVVNDFDKD